MPPASSIMASLAQSTAPAASSRWITVASSAKRCSRNGAAPQVVGIPFTASKLNAVLTVIGTVARTGLSGALIGNTAEVILDTLDSDVLVLKPDDVIDHLEELVAQR